MSSSLRCLSPLFSVAEAKEIARQYYNLDEFIDRLPSERDQNFVFQRDQSKFILKISNIDESYAVVDMQIAAVQRLNTSLRTLPSLDGQMIVTYKNHFVRLVTYIPGTSLALYQPHSSKLLLNLGRVLGQLGQSLHGFKHPSTNRDLYWNMNNAVKIITTYRCLVTEQHQWEIIEAILQQWSEWVLPRLPSLRTSVIHNDANDYNIIVNDEDTIDMIDFGDLCETYLISEVAIACAYVMLDKENPLNSASNVIAGYHQAYPLEDIEIDLVYYFIRMRLAMSVTISAHQKQLQPDDQYVVISEKPAWRLLEKLKAVDPNLAHRTFRSVCEASHSMFHRE